MSKDSGNVIKAIPNTTEDNPHELANRLLEDIRLLQVDGVKTDIAALRSYYREHGNSDFKLADSEYILIRRSLINLMHTTPDPAQPVSDNELLDKQKAIAGMLLEAGVDINLDDGAALNWAANRANIEMIRWFGANGADINIDTDGFGKTVLHRVAEKVYVDDDAHFLIPHREEVMRALIESGADVNARTAQYDLATNEVFNEQNNAGLTPLGLELNLDGTNYRRPPERLDYHYKDISKEDQSPNEAAVKVLVANGASLDFHDYDAYPDPRMSRHEAQHKPYSAYPIPALINFRTDLIPMLQSVNAMDAADEQGNTALHHMAANEFGKEIVPKLLDAGADPFARNKTGKTPAGLARDIVEELRVDEKRNAQSIKGYEDSAELIEGRQQEMKDARQQHEKTHYASLVKRNNVPSVNSIIDPRGREVVLAKYRRPTIQKDPVGRE